MPAAVRSCRCPPRPMSPRRRRPPMRAASRRTMPNVIMCSFATGLAVVLALSAGAHAQQASAAAAPAAATPAQRERATERLEAWRKGRTHVYMDDFGELKKYRAANAKLGAPGAKERRVVFYGDSI